MNPTILRWAAITLLGLAGAASASPTIELKDGSRLQGDIQGVENGAYVVASPSLGTVRVPQSAIARIIYDGAGPAQSAEPPPSPAPDARNAALAGQIQQAQAAMAQDPSIVQSIVNLQSDPQIQAILNDPVIMKQIQAQDYASLLNNPKIQALEHDENVQALVRQQAH